MSEEKRGGKSRTHISPVRKQSAGAGTQEAKRTNKAIHSVAENRYIKLNSKCVCAMQLTRPKTKQKQKTLQQQQQQNSKEKWHQSLKSRMNRGILLSTLHTLKVLQSDIMNRLMVTN